MSVSIIKIITGYRPAKLGAPRHQARCLQYYQDPKACQKELMEGSRSPNNFLHEFPPRQKGKTGQPTSEGG